MKLTMLAITMTVTCVSVVCAQTPPKATGPYRAGYIRDACRTAIQTDADPGPTGRAVAEGMCSGVIGTVMHLAPAMSEQYRFCPPPGANLKQVVPILLKCLDDHPVLLDYDLRDVINAMGRATWPCH
jgi:hypothetical protein